MNRSPLLSSKKRSVGTSYEGTQKKMMPPTPQQSSHSSIEAMQWHTEVRGPGWRQLGQHWWNARDRVVIALLEQYLIEKDSIKIEELELLLGPKDAAVNLRHIRRNASRRSGRIFKNLQLNRTG